jgi:hypothetical protein
MSDSSKQQFESARLKIHRAYGHIQELRRAINAFLETDFCRLRADTDPNSGQASIYVESVAAPPAEIALIVGDIVHNLRTALDHVIVQILGKRGNRESFPVAKEPDNPGTHSTYRLIKEILPDLAALILNKIQIHDTGDASIWSISKLDNIDKHSLLIAVVSIQELIGFGFKSEDHNIVFSEIRATISEGGRINLASMPGPITITSQGKAAAYILFGEGQPLEGKPILQSLTKMAELTTQALNTIELFWLGKGQEG